MQDEQPPDPKFWSFRILDADGPVVHLAAQGPEGEFEAMFEPRLEGNTLTLDAFSILGAGPLSLGRATLRNAARAYGRQQGVSAVVIIGTRRGSGMGIGHLPRAIRIRVD